MKMHIIVTGKVQRGRNNKKVARGGEIVFSAENAKLSDNLRIEQIKICMFETCTIITCIARFVLISQ